MFTIRNMGGVALFLFATTFLWLTPGFASRGVSTKGAWWTGASISAWVAMAIILVATWGLFSKETWWTTVALIGSAVGVLASAVYWVAASRSAETTPAFNVFVHVLGSAGVFILLLVPSLEAWVTRHVMEGR